MRWIDLHPSDAASETTTVAERDAATDADVLSAARVAHQTALASAAQAHRAAAKSWSGLAQDSMATSLHQLHASAHLSRADALSETGSPATLAGADQLESPTLAWRKALSAATQLPPAEAGVSRPHPDLRVGLVAGPRLHAGFFGLAEFRDLTSENWETQLENLDLVLIGSEAEDSREFLTETLIPAARAQGLSVALVVTSGPRLGPWSVIAESCTHVFATDPEAATLLRSHCPENTPVEVIPHPVSPMLHSPLGTRPAPTRLIALLGIEQLRPAPHLDEPQFIPPLFDGVLGSGRPTALLPPHLTPDFEATSEPTPQSTSEPDPTPTSQPFAPLASPRTFREPQPYHWAIPTDYAPWTLTRAESALLGTAADAARLQRAMDVGLAVNAVKDSQAVFDPQILQLQACGTMVFSTYNQGVNSYYPQVHIANSAEDVSKTLETMTLEELRRVQGDGIRKIFTDHHGSDVLTRIARTAGCAVQAPQDRVLVVVDHLTDALRADIASQTHRRVETTSWAELAASPQDDAEGPEPHATREAAEAPLRSRFEILVPLSSTRRYSPEYLADHVAAFRYQAASVTTKLDGDAAETDDAAHQRRAGVTDLGLSAWWRPASEALRSPDALLGTLEAGQGASNSTMPVYALDHLGHRPVGARREIDRETGTDIAEAREEFRRTAGEQGLELAVVVPIYNNGDHLRHKAFASLRRSGIFEKMHVLLINDGSTDASTAETIEELAHAWPNVSAFHHSLGGSGSASRPRNTGLALSFTEFVTYLDPDDEELEDGYWELLERLREAPEADYALGTTAVWSSWYKEHDYHAWLTNAVEPRNGVNWSTCQSLTSVDFRPASIEAMVARCGWLKALGLVQPVGAVGQDSYFFQQIFFHTRAYVPVYRPVYTYYSAVETSTVNAVSPAYFRKYLILETARADWLRHVGLLDTYVEQRFESVYANWYLEKFKRVSAAERKEAAAVLWQIAAAYGKVVWQDPRSLEFFRSTRRGV